MNNNQQYSMLLHKTGLQKMLEHIHTHTISHQIITEVLKKTKALNEGFLFFLQWCFVFSLWLDSDLTFQSYKLQACMVVPMRP